MRSGRRWHVVFLVLLAVLGLAAGWQGFSPETVAPYSDAWDYLQLARQLHGGEGFTSLFTYPAFLPLSEAAGPFPLLWRPPLYPLLVAALFLLGGGPWVWAPILLQALSYLACVLAAYYLALEFVRAGWALLAGVVAALSADLLGVAEPGIATIPFAACFTLVLLAAVRAHRRREAALVGALLGGLIMLRGESLLLAPAFLWLQWAGDRGDRERRIWIFLLAMILVLVPWTVRTWLVAGRPFVGTAGLLYVDTEAFPDWESSRRLDTLDRSALAWALTHPGMMAAKTARNLYHFLSQALVLPLPALAPFVWAALGRVTRVGRESAFCSAVLIGLLLFIVCLSPLEYAARFLHPFIPALTVVGVILLARIREELEDGGRPELSRRAARWVAAVVVALAVVQLIGDVVQVRRERLRASKGPDGAAWSQLRSMLPAADCSLADYPSYYAWHTGRCFLWYPADRDFPLLSSNGGRRRPVVMTRDRGHGAGDPTGIPSTGALAERLLAGGWTRKEIGGLDLFPGSP